MDVILILLLIFFVLMIISFIYDLYNHPICQICGSYKTKRIKTIEEFRYRTFNIKIKTKYISCFNCKTSVIIKGLNKSLDNQLLEAKILIDNYYKYLQGF